MSDLHPSGVWHNHKLSRRAFLRQFGIASSALTLSPFFMDRMFSALAQTGTVKVYLVKNGNHLQNTAKLLELAGGAASVVGPNDVIVLKCNGQWPNRGYTHTGCIKGVIDEILAIPGFDGEIHICDNVQNYGNQGGFGFDASAGNRQDNWADHNWNSLAQEYQNAGKNVATKRWRSTTTDISGPDAGVDGWMRDFFDFEGSPTYLSYPIYESPLTSGRMIDLAKGVWESGSYSTERNVKVIFLPTLNYHSDYAGITSAIKCFFGATEIHTDAYSQFRNHYNIHSCTYERPGIPVNTSAFRAGQLTARFINTRYSPDLVITCAMYSGHNGRWASATETKTVLACSNPTSLDYISCKNVIGPHNGFLNPDNDGPVRQQLLGCVDGGVGTIDPTEIELVSYDFDNPTVPTRADIEKAIISHREGATTEGQVKDIINSYMEQ